MMEQSFKVLLISGASTALSYLIDNQDMAFDIARWIPLVLGVAYTIWRWRKDIKKEKK